METIIGLILQLLILGCQIAVCILGYVLVTHGAAQQTPKGPQQGPDATEAALSEEERRMQEQMQKMMDGMNNIFGYNGTPQGDK
mgnify:CR=1 FL=1